MRNSVAGYFLKKSRKTNSACALLYMLTSPARFMSTAELKNLITSFALLALMASFIGVNTSWAFTVRVHARQMIAAGMNGVRITRLTFPKLCHNNCSRKLIYPLLGRGL